MAQTLSAHPSKGLEPLFDLVRQDSCPSKKITLTPQALLTVNHINNCLADLQTQCYDESHPLLGIVLLSPGAPLGVIWQQDDPLFWVHLVRSHCHKITSLLESIILTALKIRYYCNKVFNAEPDTLVLPLTQIEILHLIQNNTQFQTLISDFPGQLDNHLPPNKMLRMLQSLDISPPKNAFPSSQPIPNAPCAFTNANK